MNQAIRSTWVAALLLITLVLGAITYVQFFAADSLRNNPLNVRTQLKQYCSERGSIIVGGKAIVESVPTNDPSCRYVRQYNEGYTYGGVTGFYTQKYGASGIESAMGRQLAGNPDDTLNDRVAQLFVGAQPKGNSVELTLLPELQKMASDMIPENLHGSIVVMNPKTGAVLAMVSKPTYDPELLASHNSSQVEKNYQELTQNKSRDLFGSGAYRQTYSPGSVFKIIDTAAALESGKYNKDSVLPNPPRIDYPGTVASLPNYVNGNCSARPRADFSFAIAQSCNTPFASIAADLGQETLTKQATKFGFNYTTDELRIPSPVVQSPFPGGDSQAPLDPPSLARSAIGQQNVQATPLEIAMMTSAIANKGKQVKPNLVQGVRTPDLKPLEQYTLKPEVLRTSTTPEVASQITEWMVGAVDNGIARDAAVPGIKVAGKTGTAEGDLSDPNAPKNSWFTGFAPADDPQVAVAIVIQTPNVDLGRSLTSPNASKLIKAVLNI